MLPISNIDMKIQEENKAITFSVLNYQFPYERFSKPNDINYDANWLIIKVNYEENGELKIFEDPCILTWELQELADQISALLSGRKNEYISEYMEPYIEFSIVKEDDKYRFKIQFVTYASSEEWHIIDAIQLLSADELSMFGKEIREYAKLFPEK